MAMVRRGGGIFGKENHPIEMDHKGKNMRPPEAKLTTNKYDPKKEI